MSATLPSSGADKQPGGPAQQAEPTEFKRSAAKAGSADMPGNLEALADPLLVGVVDPLSQGVQQAAESPDQHDPVGDLHGHRERKDQQASADDQQGLVPVVDHKAAHEFAHQVSQVEVDWANDPAAFDKLRTAHNGTGPEVIVTNGRIELLKDWPQ